MAQRFPRQFVLLAGGALLSTIGSSMVWPFLAVLMMERLRAPWTQIGGALSLNAWASLVMAVLGGVIVDTWGRKRALVGGLLLLGVVYWALGWAHTWAVWVLLMVLWGVGGPLYRIGADAMTADLFPPEQRDEAYALLRMATNVGVAVGPALGGFLLQTDPRIPFYGAAVGLSGFGLVLLFAARETLPVGEHPARRALHSVASGLAQVMRDPEMRRLLSAYTPTVMGAMAMWIYLAAYAEGFVVTKAQYGWIASTNALMVVIFQYPVTRIAQNYPLRWVMALGALCYALGVGSVAQGSGFWMFWGSMVVMTVGEMLLVPTASAYVAWLAPVAWRGRYLALLNMTWDVGFGVISPLGGWVNTFLGFRYLWILGGSLGLIGSALFATLLGQSKAALTATDSRCSMESVER